MSPTPRTITFRQAHEAKACEGSYRRMARHLGGIETYGCDTPIPLTEVLDVLGRDDALWALAVVDLPAWAAEVAARAAGERTCQDAQLRAYLSGGAT